MPLMSTGLLLATLAAVIQTPKPAAPESRCRGDSR